MRNSIGPATCMAVYTRQGKQGRFLGGVVPARSPYGEPSPMRRRVAAPASCWWGKICGARWGVFRGGGHGGRRVAMLNPERLSGVIGSPQIGVWASGWHRHPQELASCSARCIPVLQGRLQACGPPRACRHCAGYRAYAGFYQPTLTGANRRRSSQPVRAVRRSRAARESPRLHVGRIPLPRSRPR